MLAVLSPLQEIQAEAVGSHHGLGLGAVSAQCLMGCDRVPPGLVHHLSPFVLVPSVEPCATKTCDHRDSDITLALFCLQDCGQ